MRNVKRGLLWAVLALAVGVFAGAGGAGEKLAGIEQLKTEKLAAQRGTVGQILAEELLGEDHKDQLTTYEKYVDAIAALRQGKVRAVIMDEGPAKRFLANVPGLAILEEPLSEESYAIGFKKGNDELRAQVDAALEAMKQNGTLQVIIDKYVDNVEIKPEDIDLNVGAAGGKLVMGTEAGFAPYELKVGDGYIGIDIEMAAIIAKRLGKELVIENLNFDALPMAVASGKVDMICAGISVTEERKKNMDFSINYVDGAKQVAVIRAEDCPLVSGDCQSSNGCSCSSCK